MELWLTQEDWSGYLVGWQGCMAEDSISFLKAFDAVKIGERVNDGKVTIFVIFSKNSLLRNRKKFLKNLFRRTTYNMLHIIILI